MDRQLRIGLRAAGIVATLAAGAGVAFMLYSDSRVAGSVVARPLGWVAAVVVALSLAGVGWVLLGVRRSDGGPAQTTDRTRCPACQREIPGKWRMCPYCGEMAERDPAVEAALTDRITASAEGGSSCQ